MMVMVAAVEESMRKITTQDVDQFLNKYAGRYLDTAWGYILPWAPNDWLRTNGKFIHPSTEE